MAEVAGAQAKAGSALGGPWAAELLAMGRGSWNLPWDPARDRPPWMRVPEGPELRLPGQQAETSLSVTGTHPLLPLSLSLFHSLSI